MTSAGDESFPGHLRKLGLTKEGMKAQTELDAKRGGVNDDTQRIPSSTEQQCKKAY